MSDEPSLPPPTSTVYVIDDSTGDLRFIDRLEWRNDELPNLLEQCSVLRRVIDEGDGRYGDVRAEIVPSGRAGPVDVAVDVPHLVIMLMDDSAAKAWGPLLSMIGAYAYSAAQGRSHDDE